MSTAPFSARPRGAATARSRLRSLAAAVLLAVAPLSLGSVASAPAAHAEGTALSDRSAAAAAGEPVTFRLLDGTPGVNPASVRLLLDSLPPGSTLSADGRLAVVPGQGTWRIAADGATATFRPDSPRPVRQAAPVRYTASDTAGRPLDPASLTVVTAVIPSLVRAAPYGRPIVFDLAGTLGGVRTQTLRLEAMDPSAPTTVDSGGTRATVRGQGTWSLDRAHARVVFTPASAGVVTASPITLRADDAQGEPAAPGVLRVGYPALLDQNIAASSGESVQFSPMDSSRNVRADSLALTATGAPRGAALATDASTLTVPGEGRWRIDRAARTVTFSPAGDLAASPHPVTVTARGLFDVHDTTSARLSVQVSDAAPFLRGDELRVAPGGSVSGDVLANDMPGTAAAPLQASSIRLRSLDALASQRDARTGSRTLTVPGEATYSVRSDGVVTVTPAPGFVGVATPVEYVVQDEDGVRVSAPIAVDVDPQAPAVPAGAQPGGIHSVLLGLQPGATATFAVFASLAALLIFSGAASLCIGSRMENERRTP